MSSTKHFSQRQIQRNGNLDMSYYETQNLPNPRYPNQYYRVEYCYNGTRVIPVDRRTGAQITVMTNANGSTIDGVSIGLRRYYNYPPTYDQEEHIKPTSLPN